MRISIPFVDAGVTLTLDVQVDSLQPFGEIEDEQSGETIQWCRECGEAGGEHGVWHRPGCSFTE